MGSLKVLLLCLFLFACGSDDSGMFGPNYVEYTPNVSTDRLTEYFGQKLERLSKMRFWMASARATRVACGDALAIACTYPKGHTFISSKYAEDCFTITHERMHQALTEVMGNPDGGHVTAHWDNIKNLCD